MLHITAALVALAVGVGGYSLKTSGTRMPNPWGSGVALRVPRITGAVRVDGRLDEPTWAAPAGRLGDERAQLAHDETWLFVALRTRGARAPAARHWHELTLVFTDERGQKRTIAATQVPPRCTVLGAGSCAAWTTEGDAGPWTVEMAIPLEALGLTAGARQTRLVVEHCEQREPGAARCERWGTSGKASSDVLVLE